ncbi:MAG: G5 domain-containing protein [Chthonomonas sp.]|nr:G5 domain-containing protein [Chthonomonas sp.]
MMNSKAPALLSLFLAVVLAMPAIARQEDAKTTSEAVPVEVKAEAKPETKVITKVVVKKIPHTVEYHFDRTLAPGRVRKNNDGQDGEVRTTIEIVQDNQGKEISRRQINVETIPMKPAIIGMGKQGHATSRGSFTRSQVMVVESTAYTPSAGLKNPTFRTKMGLRAKYGVIAVDPRKIKLGTLCFVEGYGFAIAADIGSAIKGNKIDVCVPTLSEARRWGRRKVTIHVFNERSNK